MYRSNMWNPTYVLDHIADVMTYVRNIENEGRHGIEFDPTAMGVPCTI